MKSWKKTTILLLVVALVCSTALIMLAGCSGSYNIMFISNKGNVLDDDYNEVLWNTIRDYGEKTDVAVATMSPLGQETKDFQNTLKKCADNYNAKFIVCASATFRDVLTPDFVSKYPSTTFICFDDVDHTSQGYYTKDEMIEKGSLFKSEVKKVRVYMDDFDKSIPSNVIYARFDLEEIGYAAGYSAAQLGNKIGFLGASNFLPAIETTSHVDELGNEYVYALGNDGTTTITDDNPVKYNVGVTDAIEDYYEGFVEGVKAYAGANFAQYTIVSSCAREDDSDLAKRDLVTKWVNDQGINVIVGAAGNSYNEKLNDMCATFDTPVKFVNCDYNLTVKSESREAESTASVVRNYEDATIYLINNVEKYENTNDFAEIGSSIGVKTAIVYACTNDTFNGAQNGIIKWALS